MSDLVERLLEHPTLGSMVVHRRRIEGSAARHAEPHRPLPPALAEVLAGHGLTPLWEHQARGLNLLREGRNVLLATPTASGKSLLFSIALLESLLDEPRAKALLVYPTKALAQDQLSGFRSLAASVRALEPPRFEIYDGDTPAARRRKIRADPPAGLITNPDMLHFGILAHHGEWQSLLRDLRWIVLDELHVYRGLFGSHVHHILHRLQRLCREAGSAPRFVAASATVGNPAQFAQTLVGRPFEVVERSGAPRSPLDVVFLNPIGVSPYTAALRVLIEALHCGRKTIVFTKARRITELLYTWLARQEPRYRSRVAPYRAGYLPEERRRLEERLFRGDLSAVLATSALELGIDVGRLDLCVLVGYPGSLISSWQRVGRVGRLGRGGTVVLVALPDALDQYVVRHPQLFFEGRFESAVLDPDNPLVAGRHLVCAAAERPLTDSEIDRRGPGARRAVEQLVREGPLVEHGEGRVYFSFRRRPHRDVHPRSAGEPFQITEVGSQRRLGSIDGMRVYHECHPGAVYLHGGRSYRVLELDSERRRVVAEAADVDYYTVVLGDKETEILERSERRMLHSFPVGLGRLRVTVRIREYQKKRLFDGEPLATHPLDVPPLVFETTGFWLELPRGFPRRFAERGLDFMGAIHAVEHATIGLFPLLAIADRDDVGGISYTGHPQTGGPAIFVYDGVPGGAGLAERGYRELEALLDRTADLVGACECADGCPACIHSPKCGNGNKPLDKKGAMLALRCVLGRETLEPSTEAQMGGDEAAPRSADRASARPRRRHGITRRAADADPVDQAPGRSSGGPLAAAATGRTLVFDLETQRGADEVGGWAHVERMGLALAVVYDMQRGSYTTYFETDVHRLLLDLVMADRVVGFNIERFDLRVLAAYSDWDLRRIRTLDLLGSIHRRLGFRLSLAHLCEVNLGEAKAGDGLQSLEWWRQGRIDLIEQYCRKDVELTRRIFELGRDRGFLLYRDHSARRVRVPVEWGEDPEEPRGRSGRVMRAPEGPEANSRRR